MLQKCAMCGVGFQPKKAGKCCGPNCAARLQAEIVLRKQVLDCIGDAKCPEHVVLGYDWDVPTRVIVGCLRELVEDGTVERSLEKEIPYLAIVHKKKNQEESPVEQKSSPKNLLDLLDSADSDVVILYTQAKQKAKLQFASVEETKALLIIQQAELDKVTENLIEFRAEILKGMKV